MTDMVNMSSRYWQMPYYWAGCKLYDILAGGENMESSYIMSKGKALEAFPLLKADGLVGAMVYYDGQHNDSRMNLALILTSVLYGATVANYTEVTALQTDEKGKLSSATVKDTLTGHSFEIRAKVDRLLSSFRQCLIVIFNHCLGNC